MFSGRERVQRTVIIVPPLIGLAEFQGHHASQACYKSGIIPPEYQDELCVERTFLTIVREAEILL